MIKDYNHLCPFNNRFDLMEHTVLDTLETYLSNQGAVSVSEACDMAISVLNILEYCHGRNMTHNNITPAKIIVDKGKPTLIDYSFPINGNNGTNGNGSNSKTSKFITLPELQIDLDHGSRNNTISDITATAGLVLYALTQETPGELKDDEGRMPHQRPEVRAKIDEAAGYKNFMLNQIFDRAFQWQHKDRYQTSPELIDDLRKLKKYRPRILPVKRLDEIVTEVRSNTQSQTITPIELCLQTALNGVRKICSEVVSALEEDFRELEAGYRKELEKPVYTAHLNLNYDLNKANGLLIEFRIEIVGSEIVVSGCSKLDGEETNEELYRGEHTGFTSSEEMENSVLEFVAANMSAFVNKTIGR